MNVRILEMPLDFGASRHGSDMGPSAIRLAGLREMITRLGHNPVKCFSPMELHPQEYETADDIKVKYLKPIVKACTQLASQVDEAASAGDFPLVLGGDHSIVLGSLAGLASAYRKTEKKLGVLYVDAHGDFNTPETSPSGNIHGMCLSGSCGIGPDELTNLYYKGRKVDPVNVCYVGLRDIDDGERELMKAAGVTAFTMTDIERHGFAAIAKKVVTFFRSHADVVHVSFDMDVIDPMFAPGVGIQVPGGLNYREALFLMEEIANTGLVHSADIVEVNPVLDVRNQTARMAVELLGRLLGDRIY